MADEPIPLKSLPPYQSSSWVLHNVREISKCVGIEHEGFKKQFMALVTTIEEGPTQSKKLGSKK